MTTDPQTCPNCHHDQHLPGTDCDAAIGHGPNRWHRCLCLARPGAALSCPPQMTCQGGTLGYADIWYLQHGHTLVTADGAISPEAVVQTGVMSVGFPSGAPEPTPVAPAAAPPTGQTGLRDRIAEALIAWTYRGKDPEHGGILETVRANAYSRADAVLAVLPAPVDQADDADRRAYAWAQTVDTDDGDIYIPGVHSSGTGLEAVAIVVHREDIPVLAGMLAEAGGGPVDRGFVLAEAERQFLAFALDLAADQMASRGDEFGDEDTAALDTLRRLAAETVGPETQGAQLPCQCSHGEAYHDFKYGGPRCRLCPESGEWTWRHAFRSATAPAVVAEPGKEA